MKYFLLLPVGFFACALAFAGVPEQMKEKTPSPKHNWFCTATGYDSSGRSRSFSGERYPTERDAEDSAVRLCMSSGLLNCHVDSCFDTGT